METKLEKDMRAAIRAHVESQPDVVAVRKKLEEVLSRPLPEVTYEPSDFRPLIAEHFDGLMDGIKAIHAQRQAEIAALPLHKRVVARTRDRLANLAYGLNYAANKAADWMIAQGKYKR